MRFPAQAALTRLCGGCRTQIEPARVPFHCADAKLDARGWPSVDAQGNGVMEEQDEQGNVIGSQVGLHAVL